MSDPYPGQFTDVVPLDAEATAARKKRNNWLGLALAAFVLLVGVITMIRLSSADLSKGSFYYDADGRSGATQSTSSQPLPPGMSEADAAPPEGITPTPAPQETPE